jgi:hypothetical protein
MTKKHANTRLADEILSLRLDANGTAELLGLSVARIHQLRREGTLKAGEDGLYSAVDALRSHYLYDSPRGDAMRAHARHRNARALELEVGTRRQLRRLLNLDEVRQVAGLVFERATEAVQAESSRFFHEHSRSHGEHEARLMTDRLYEPLFRIPDCWGEGVMQLCKDLDRDHMPDDGRLDDVLRELIAAIAAANKADAKKLSHPTPP